MAEIREDIPILRLVASIPDCCILDELLSALELDVSAWSDSKEYRVQIYCTDQADQDEKASLLQGNLDNWQDLLSGPVTLETDNVRREDWTEVWKKYFHPEQISERIAIKPSWEELPFAPPECVIEIDPGMSFGTGRHGTTAACLQMIDSIAREFPGASFLDIGCGSGILSIAAIKLGLEPVELFDFDPDAVSCAQENLANNHIRHVTPFVCDVGEYQPEHPFQVVVANLESHILLRHIASIRNTVQKGPNSRLILSGILRREYGHVIKSFEGHGFRKVESVALDEWESGCLRWKA